MIDSIVELFERGGWLMAPLAVLAVALFGQLLRLALDTAKVSRRWQGREVESVDAFEAQVERSGMAGAKTLGAYERYVGWRRRWFADFRRRARLLRILAGAAPLLGLLGTVTGMLKTFHGLSRKAVMDSMDTVASGISEALVTTQTGLSFGVLAVVLLYFITNYGKRLNQRLDVLGADLLLKSAELEGRR